MTGYLSLLHVYYMSIFHIIHFIDSSIFCQNLHYVSTVVILCGVILALVERKQSCIHIKCQCFVLCAILYDYGFVFTKVGITTDRIDKTLHHKCISAGAYPSPLHYRGFPKSVCTSVNNVACHGIPDNTALCDGDIVTVDITVSMISLLCSQQDEALHLSLYDKLVSPTKHFCQLAPTIIHCLDNLWSKIKHE